MRGGPASGALFRRGRRRHRHGRKVPIFKEPSRALWRAHRPAGREIAPRAFRGWPARKMAAESPGRGRPRSNEIIDSRRRAADLQGAADGSQPACPAQLPLFLARRRFVPLSRPRHRAFYVRGGSFEAARAFDERALCSRRSLMSNPVREHRRGAAASQ